MHKLIADPQIAQVRKRASEGDCPITPSLSVESLEDLVLHLALYLDDAENKNRSTKINPEAYAAILAVVRSAWALVDNTGYHEWYPPVVNRDDWDDLAARMAALKALIPHGELPADPPHAVVLLWPDMS